MEAGDPYTRLINIVEETVKMLREDYIASRRAGIISVREEVYKRYYRVEPNTVSRQDKPIIFVDAGFHLLETDVASLLVMSLGGVVRDPEGRLLYPPSIGDYEFPETLLIYGRFIMEESGPGFSVKIIPFTTENILFRGENARVVSSELNKLIGEKSRLRITSLRDLKLFKKFIKYLEGLIEVAYGLKMQDLIGSHSLVFVDGTLSRWFSIPSRIKQFNFDGLDVLGLLTGFKKEDLVYRLKSVYGLVKQSKITSIARARWLFASNVKNPLGLHTYTNPDSARVAAQLINDRIRRNYGGEAAREVTRLFNRVIHPSMSVWAARFPLTTDGSTIIHLEAHLDKPVVGYDDKNGAYPIEESAQYIEKTVPVVVRELLSHRSMIYWYPPYGFMELDEKVRIPMSRLRRLEDLFINTIRKYTGEEGHPLEYLFESTRRMRLGY